MDVDFFPVGLSEMAADFKILNISDKKINIDSIVVDWQEQIYHPGGSVRHRLSVGDKNIVYATDVELDRIFNKDFSHSSTENFAKDYLDFIQDADILIADGQDTKEE